MNRKALYLIGPVSLVLAVVLIFGYSLTLAQNGQRALESAAVGTAFTYQGHLNDGGVPADGNYDFEFGLYDALTIGSQVGITVPQTIAVSDGLFTTALDFGPDVFNGEPRFLEIAVKLSGGGGFTSLTPRQPLTAVPYASYADKVQPVKNVVTVAKSGGDYTSVQDALDNITATVDDRNLIRVAPGVYTGTVDLESYVDIEGSGEGITILRGLGSDIAPASDGSSATVRAAGDINAEVRFLTIESKGAGHDYATGIRIGNFATSNFRLTHVTLSGSGSLNNFGMFILHSSPSINTVTTTGLGPGTNNFGVYNFSSSPTMNNVTATGSGGTLNRGVLNFSGSSPTIRDSAFTGATNSILNINSDAKIANTILDGPVAGSVTFTFTCLNTFDTTFAAVVCP